MSMIKHNPTAAYFYFSFTYFYGGKACFGCTVGDAENI